MFTLIYIIIRYLTLDLYSTNLNRYQNNKYHWRQYHKTLNPTITNLRLSVCAQRSVVHAWMDLDACIVAKHRGSCDFLFWETAKGTKKKGKLETQISHLLWLFTMMNRSALNWSRI